MAGRKNDEREAREARDRLRRYSARQTVHSHKLRRRIRDNVFALVGLVLVAGLATTAQILYFTAGPGAPTPVPTDTSTPDPSATDTNVGDVPLAALSENREWTGTFTLNDIELGVALDGVAAPQAVAVMVQAAESGYYVDTTCHRLVVSASAGLLQCGSLDGTGSSDPDFAFGPLENVPADDVYKAGTIAMARASGNGYSQGHQIFIVFADTNLPKDAAGGYTVIGTVTSGLDELKAKIVDGGITPGANGEEDGAPVISTTISAFRIE